MARNNCHCLLQKQLKNDQDLAERVFMKKVIRILFSMKTIALYLVLIGFNYCAYSQEELQHQVSLQHDNDFLLGIDRYYTTGSFLGYSKRLTNHFIFKNTEATSLQLDIRLGQETYTPRELFETNFDLLERPYAGYLYTTVEVSQSRTSDIWTLQGELGFAGPQSFAGEIQVAYHNLINEFIPVWEGEIANSIHVNAYGSYLKSFQKEKNIFFDLNSTIALGTRQLYAEQGATLFFGNRDRLGQSSFYNRIGSAPEWYGYAGAFYRYQALNALIQGHPWGDDSPFTLPIQNSILGARAGLVLRKASNTFQIEYVSQTNESPREGQLQYVSVIYKRAF